MAKVIVCKCELTSVHHLPDFCEYDSVWVLVCVVKYGYYGGAGLMSTALLSAHTHTHTCAHKDISQFHSPTERGVYVREASTPTSFRRHEIFNGCVCVCLCVSERSDACLQLFWLGFGVLLLRWRKTCTYIYLYKYTPTLISAYKCIYVYVCVCVCARKCAWLSGLSQTAQNSLQSDISPVGDKWWLDERERWGSARISVGLCWRHIYTRAHTDTRTHTLIHWQNTADTQNYQTRGWTLRDGQANLLIVQSCTCVLVCLFLCGMHFFFLLRYAETQWYTIHVQHTSGHRIYTIYLWH